MRGFFTTRPVSKQYAVVKFACTASVEKKIVFFFYIFSWEYIIMSLRTAVHLHRRGNETNVILSFTVSGPSVLRERISGVRHGQHRHGQERHQTEHHGQAFRHHKHRRDQTSTRGGAVLLFSRRETFERVQSVHPKIMSHRMPFKLFTRKMPLPSVLL